MIVAHPGRTAGEIRARFGVRTSAELDALPGRDDPRDSSYPVRFTAEGLRRVGGPTLRVPDVRHPDDLALLERLMCRFPPLGSVDGWAARFGSELNASDDRASFGPSGLPVIEGKHLEPFRVDVGGATFHLSARDGGPVFCRTPRYMRPPARLSRCLERRQHAIPHRRRPACERRDDAHALLPANAGLTRGQPLSLRPSSTHS